MVLPASSGHTLALVGLSSVGLELARIDASSEPDFFAIVEPGHKARDTDTFDWLAAAAPII